MDRFAFTELVILLFLCLALSLSLSLFVFSIFGFIMLRENKEVISPFRTSFQSYVLGYLELDPDGSC